MAATGNERIVQWFKPLLVGPFLGAWAFALFRGVVAHDVGATVVYLLLSNAIALLQVVMLAAIDVGLLKMKLRALPTGLHAWWTSMAAPFIACTWVGLFPRPGASVAFVGIVLGLIVFAPMLITSITLRLVFGKAP